ncbi:hypothetical protein FACHB389_04650 [Nostoc calcicola FACHB-389]|nr:hypothetical protein [Nostoc calcicola FACHB-3891]OKH41451.1 hypothetical protein FACHB389_04650 [Nostoc calcicola FACHB-389]
MNWSNLAKIKASLILVFIFGVYTFIIGLTYNQLPESLSDKQKQFISFIGSPAIAIFFLTLINYRISEEVEADVKLQFDTKERDLKDEYQNKLEDENKYFIEKYKDYVKELESKIKSLTSSQKRDELLKIIYSLSSAPENFKATRQAEKEIVKWFDTPGNKLALLSTAEEAVSQAKYNIPKKYKEKFYVDIDQCINWLHDTVVERTECLVESSKHASVIVHIPEKYKPYEVALRAIENHLKENQYLKQYYDKADIVQTSIDYLINQLKTFST